MARLLIADDDPDNRDILRTFFEGEGFCVTVASCAEEALSSALREPPAVVLLDLQMPQSADSPALDAEAGLRVLEGLRASAATQGIPVVVLSGYDADALRAKLAGFDRCDIGTKPYDFAGLLDTVARLRDGA